MYQSFNVRIVHGRPSGGVAPNAPAIEHDILHFKSQFVYRELKHDIDGVLFLIRKRHSLKLTENFNVFEST